MPAAPTLAPTMDLAAAYPEIVSLRAALLAGDWAAVQAILAEHDPAARTRLIRLGAETSAAAPFLRERVKADPSDTLAAALLAGRLIEDAWEVRTGARAEHVSREQFARFHEILRDAERLLIDAAAYDPSDPAVWTQRLITARGLQLGQSEARRRYDRLAEHHPHHLPAQSQLLQQLAPKWSGSLEAMHAFARTEMLAAPEGAPNAVLVVDAHIEHALLTLKGDDRARHFQRADVKEQVHEAASRSVLHPAYQRTVGWVSVENTFAFMFTMMDDYVPAARLFTGLGHLVSELPWAYLGDPVKLFGEFRDRAMKKGGTR
ncbi:hypothetical protein [Micromonospora pisi]|nr:hypothetical protein [Micromonospora pisi]